jgi:hypothetical protein
VIAKKIEKKLKPLSKMNRLEICQRDEQVFETYHKVKALYERKIFRFLKECISNEAGMTLTKEHLK